MVRNVVSRLTQQPPTSPPAVYSTKTVHASSYTPPPPPRVPSSPPFTSKRPTTITTTSSNGGEKQDGGEDGSPLTTTHGIKSGGISNRHRSNSPITKSIINPHSSPWNDVRSKESSPQSPLSPSVSFKIISSRSGAVSAPSTLDKHYYNKGTSCTSSRLPEGRSDTTLKSCKPDNSGVVLKTKDGGSSSGLVSPSLLTYPEVVNPHTTTTTTTSTTTTTTSSSHEVSRPSSVVIDKPPSGPEVLRPTAIRTTLRKTQEIGGTCFMASKREKKADETPKKTDLFKDFHQQRNRERWSKGDMKDDLNVPCLLSPESATDDGVESKFEAASELFACDIKDERNYVGCAVANADSLVDECENYLVSADRYGTSPVRMPRQQKRSQDSAKISQDPAKQMSTSTSSLKGIMSDTSQKNGVGDSEGNGEESKRLAHQKDVKRENRVNFNVIDFKCDDDDETSQQAAVEPSGSPDSLTIGHEEEAAVLAIAGELTHGRNLSQRHRSLDGEYLEYYKNNSHHQHRVRSPEPQSILKRRYSRDDALLLSDRPITPEPHGILKRKSSSRGSSSRASSVDDLGDELIPILKKKSSTEDLDHFEPKPILKKKSSTDDELEDRPKSILKSCRSGEDLHSGGDSGVISPTPILKWSSSSRCGGDCDGDELRPTSILKRRDTSEGVRHIIDDEDCCYPEGGRVRSDSAPETGGSHRSRSPTMSATNLYHSTHSSPSHRGSYRSTQQQQQQQQLQQYHQLRDQQLQQQQQQQLPPASILKNRWSSVSLSEDGGCEDHLSFDHHLPERDFSAILQSRRGGEPGGGANEMKRMGGDHSTTTTPPPSFRPISPSLSALRRESLERRGCRSARPLSVSDRIAGMEVTTSSFGGSLPGARPKLRASSFSSRPFSQDARDKEAPRRSSWTNIERLGQGRAGYVRVS